MTIKIDHFNERLNSSSYFSRKHMSNRLMPVRSFFNAQLRRYQEQYWPYAMLWMAAILEAINQKDIDFFIDGRFEYMCDLLDMDRQLLERILIKAKLMPKGI